MSAHLVPNARVWHRAGIHFHEVEVVGEAPLIYGYWRVLAADGKELAVFHADLYADELGAVRDALAEAETAVAFMRARVAELGNASGEGREV